MTDIQPQHRHVPSCTSTSDLARAWAAHPVEPAAHGSWVTADYQTQGRGRRGRSWQAAPGENVLLSMVLRPSFPQSDAWQLGFLAALAVADVLEEGGLEPQLKWPNDVLVQGKKAVGVLVETVPAGALSSWAAVAGIGLNVNQEHFENADLLLYPPTSLYLATGWHWDIADVAQTVANALLLRVAQRDADGWEAVWPDWQRCVAHGAVLKRGNIKATLVDVNQDGSARVRLPDGTFAVWTSVE